jgi:hypothetical protein
MSKKSAGISARISRWQGLDFNAHYLGYFDCFNSGLFFEAHDVLEELWLAEGRQGPYYSFYKGLIQLAGAFVHLQKDRLQPALSLFQLAETNLKKYPVKCLGWSTADGLALIDAWRQAVRTGADPHNPIRTQPYPQLTLPAGICSMAEDAESRVSGAASAIPIR